MKKFTNTWYKGWNRDKAKNKYGNENYYYAENLRLNDKTEGSTYNLTNIDGNILAGSLFGMNLYAYTVLRDSIYVLAINPAKITTSGYNDMLYKFAINSEGTLTRTLLYSGLLELDPNAEFKKMIGRYESPTIQKVYWTCGGSIKFANVADPNLPSYTSERFNIMPSHSPGIFTIDSINVGSLSSGVVQYAYQLYNLNGASTAFITSSPLVPLSTDSLLSGTDLAFNGSQSTESANKSITFTITNIDNSNFNRIKIVRIFYTSLLTDPIITFIADVNSDSTITYTDTGSDNLGTLTLEEYNFINYSFNCNCLEVKNNILFAGNIVEKVYDPVWDSRAYRFAIDYGSSTIRAKIFEENNSSSDFIDVTTSNWSTVPETHNCINYFKNTLSEDSNVASIPSLNFQYKSDGSTIGAEGINVEIGVTTDTVHLDDNISGTQYYVNSTNRNSNSAKFTDYSFYQRDEVYAFAIELISDKGIKSSAKWICDFRMPRQYPVFGIASSNTGDCIGIGVYPVFTIKNLPSDCAAYRILRCERSNKDRTILSQGILDCATHDGTTSSTNVRRPGATLVSIKEYVENTLLLNHKSGLDRTILQLHSPEISFNKNISYIFGDYVEIIGYATMTKHFYKTSLSSTYSDDLYWAYQYRDATSINIKKIGYISETSKQKISITEGSLVTPPPYRSMGLEDAQFGISFGGKTYVNSTYGDWNTSTYNLAKGCTKFLVNTSDTITQNATDSLNFGNKFFVFNYRRPTIQYGGNTYQSRMNRTYIPCTSFVPSTTSSINVRNGDTFIEYFECNRAMIVGLDNEYSAGYPASENFFESICFPVETSIHTKWQNNKTFNQEVNNPNSILYQETAGLQIKSYSGIRLEQELDLYSYNSVYSISNKSSTAYPKNDLVSENKVFDARIQWSERKYNNENIDSWTIWKPLNFKDVDNQYGKIQSIVNYNTRLIYFQPTALGVLSVDERELASGTNSSQLVLGTGSVGSRFDYISTACGTIHSDSLIACKNGLYWYDRYNNSFFVYEPTGNIDNVTKLSGIQSYLYENIPDTANLINVVTGYDPKYNEVLFTFNTNDTWNGKKTIAYNEMSKYFVGTFSFEPEYYINTPEYFYSTTNLEDFYKHNSTAVNKCVFYDQQYISKLEAIVNPEGDRVVRFDILEWITDYLDTLGQTNFTFTRIGAMNDYTSITNAATGYPTAPYTIPIGSSNIVRRFRTWRFNHLRDYASEERMKDYYLKVLLVFSNNYVGNSATLKIHDLTTTYEHTAPY